MDAKDVIRHDLHRARMTSMALLGDLSDAYLLIRSQPGCNHIAWQLGHLISTEFRIGEGVEAGAMPSLPEGFADKYTKDTASVDDPAVFLTKQEYLDLYDQQRQALLNLLERVEDSRLDEPSPERFQKLAPSIGLLIHLAGGHELMHTGQWTPVRRMLGKPHVM